VGICFYISGLESSEFDIFSGGDNYFYIINITSGIHNKKNKRIRAKKEGIQMKVAFITVSCSTNYGAVLQTYALYHFLKEKGMV